jgi:hypothetical protein
MEINDLLLVVSLLFLGIGTVSFFSGLIVILSKIMGNSIAKIALETKKIVQKGITEEVAGLVGNASILLNSINDLIKTATGVGVFLIIIGILFMTGSLYVLIQLQ